MKPSIGERILGLLAALGKSLCYLVLFMGMQVAVMVLVSVVALVQVELGGGVMDEQAVTDFINDNSMAFSLISNLITLAVVVVFYLIRRKKLSEALWLRKVPSPVLWEGAALAPSLYVIVSIMLILLPEAWLDSYNEASAGVGSGGVFGVLAVAVAAPVVEEVIFRGLIMTRLSRAMPGWLAVVLSAAIFGACHGHPVWFCYAFILGVVFGLMDLKAGSILPSILGHVVFNAIGQVFTYLPETETGEWEMAAVCLLLLMAVAAPLFDRKAIAAIFRPAPKAAPAPAAEEPAAKPRNYDYDPWDM